MLDFCGYKNKVFMAHKVVNIIVLRDTIEDTAVVYGTDTVPIPYTTLAAWYAP